MTEIQWDVSGTRIDSADAVKEWLVFQTQRYNPQGTRGLALWFGPNGAERAEMELRLDVDPDADRAAARWLPENLVAVDLPPLDDTLRVCVSAYDPELAEIPGELARIDVATAFALAADYVDTGRRPDQIKWEAVKK